MFFSTNGYKDNRQDNINLNYIVEAMKGDNLKIIKTKIGKDFVCANSRVIYDEPSISNELWIKNRKGDKIIQKIAYRNIRYIDNYQ